MTWRAHDIDDYIMRQLDDYWDHPDPDCEDEDCGECPACIARDREDYEAAKAEAMMDERRLHDILY